MPMTNSDAWAAAVEEVRQERPDLLAIPDEADDSPYWTEVERRAVKLGGRPAQPAGTTGSR